MDLAALIAAIAAAVIALLIFLRLQSLHPERSEQMVEERLKAIREDLAGVQSLLNSRLDSATRESQSQLSTTLAAMGSSMNETLSRNRQELAGGLTALSDSMQQRFERLQRANAEKLEEIRGQVERKLSESVDRSFGAVQEMTRQLGDLKVSQERLVEIGKDINQLSDILQAPKLRGNFGEFEMESLLRQVVPAEQLRMQCLLDEGLVVDAAIELREGLLCIDSKFPLATFQRLSASGLEAAERTSLDREFDREVRKHLDSIADKYIVPERTLDFAFMFVPAESVYYEILQRPDLMEYARGRRVVPVSPNTLYAYLAIIAVGFKGMQIERQAAHIGKVLSGLKTNLERYRRDLELVGRHLDNARKSLDVSHRDLRRVDETVSSLHLGNAIEMSGGDDSGDESPALMTDPPE